ncbi:MAG: nucleotidyltransferase family protein [Pseudomonadota bacterium]
MGAADRVLREAGFARRWPAADPPQRGRDMFMLLANVFDYVHPATGQLVELHHRMTLNPHWTPAGFAELYRTSVRIDTAQGPIRGLDGPQLISYLCWHAFAHAGFRLKWICDIVRALRREGGGTAAQLCPASGGFPQKHIELADALASQVLAEVDGSGPGGVPAARRSWRRHVARIVADMEAPQDLPTERSFRTLRSELAFRLFIARLSPGLKGKGYELLRAATDPRDVPVLRLRARYAPAYALVGPVLALHRWFSRRRGKNVLPHLD